MAVILVNTAENFMVGNPAIVQRQEKPGKRNDLDHADINGFVESEQGPS